MRLKSSEPGAIVSGAAHLALLAVTLLAFSDTRKFEDTQESVPVEMVTDQQFNDIMKGEKTARETKPTPPKANKIAEVEDHKPIPKVEAKTDVPTPPPPLKRIPDPGEDETPTPPEPPRRVAELPPTPPAPPPKPEPRQEPTPKPEAEAIDPPKPPPRPQPPKTPPTPPKEEAKPKPVEKPLDKVALAKLLEDKKPDTPKPASRPKSGDETNEPRHRFDTAALSRMLSSEPPGQRPSTARALSQTASIGAPNANAARMSPSMWGQLDALLQEQYKACWTYLGLGGEARYIPQIKVEYARDGALVGQPSLLNPPSDPNLRNLAESALRAVRRCNPLRIPPQFTPYFDQWKARILRFDPEEMAG